MNKTMSNMSSSQSLKVVATIALVIIFLHWLPYVVMGEGAYLTIHDYLDSSFIKAKVIADSGQIFAPSSAVIAQYDIPRVALRSEFQFPSLLNTVFSPLAAHIFLTIFMQITAFIGMFMLLNRNYSKGELPIVSLGVALCFALLPFWPPGVLGIAGMPLVLYAFLELREKNASRYLWIIIVLFPFFSSLITVGFFFLCLLTSIFVFDLAIRRQFNRAFFLGIILLCSIYLLVEYRLILNSLDPIFASHRQEAAPKFHPTSRALTSTWKNFLYGQYHVHSLQSKVIWPTILVAISLTILGRKFQNTRFLQLIGLIFLCAILSTIYGFWTSSLFEPIRTTIPGMLKFNFSRFHWLHPLLWTLSFAWALTLIKAHLKNKVLGISFVCLAIVCQAFWAGYENHPIKVAHKKHGITFEKFFAESLFAEVKQDISAPIEEYRVASVGLHPAIAAYNGFQTIDWYLTYYPLQKKQNLRKIIGKELEKDESLKQYFDGWGNRLYLFSADLGRDFLAKRQTDFIEMPEFDLSELRLSGVRFLFSRVELKNGPPLFGKYTHDDSHWDIYVYSLDL